MQATAAAVASDSPAPCGTTSHVCALSDLPSSLEQAAASRTDMPTAIQRCYVSHPGSLCCATAFVKRDHAAATCVLTVQATVRMTEPGATVAMHDLEELGWMVAQHTAADLVTAWNPRASRPPGREERHQTITHILQHGSVVESQQQVSSSGHVSYRVMLQDSVTNIRLPAVFKPRVDGDCDGWHRVAIEEAAYRLNLLLGMDLVPPAVFRPSCDVDWHTFERGGTFMYWAGSAGALQSVPSQDWGMDPRVLLSDTRILDVLIQNSDRHAGHFLMGEHWAQAAGEGSCGRWSGTMWPILVDHAAGFRPTAHVALEHDNAFSTGPCEHISARTYLRLRFLDGSALQELLGGLVSRGELAGLVARCAGVLQRFDHLVQLRGFAAVVIE